MSFNFFRTFLAWIMNWEICCLVNNVKILLSGTSNDCIMGRLSLL